MIDSITVYGYLGSIGKKHFNKLLQRDDTVDSGAIFGGHFIRVFGIDAMGIYHQSAFTSEAVIIAIPSDAHYELAKDAIEQGKHVLLEKPVTLNYKEAQTLYRLAKAHGVVYYTGHCYRYLPQFQKNLPELYHAPMLDFKLLVPHDKPDIELVFDLLVHGVEIAFYLGDQDKGRNFKLKSANYYPEQHAIFVEANIGSKDCQFHVGYNQPHDVRLLQPHDQYGPLFDNAVDFHSSDGQDDDAMSRLHNSFIKACNVGAVSEEAEWATAAIQLCEKVQEQVFS